MMKKIMEAPIVFALRFESLRARSLLFFVPVFRTGMRA